MENFLNKIVKNHVHYYLPIIFGCFFFHLICFSLGKISETTIPKFFNFYIPTISALLGLLLTHLLEDKKKTINHSLIVLFIINFLWLIYLSDLHSSDLRAHVFILGLILINLSIIGRYRIKETLIIGLGQLALFTLYKSSLYFFYDTPIRKSDLYIYHYFFIITFFITLFNKIISDKSNNSKLLQKDLDGKKVEIKDILDNLTTSFFAIGKDFKIEQPISRYSEKIFEKEIVGLNVFELLYSNIDRETKDFKDLHATYSIIFGSDDLQFLALKENLPLKVPFVDEKSNTKKVLKLRYQTLLNDKKKIEQIRCVAEDITESEEILLEAKHDQTNFNYIKEVVSIRSKNKIATNLENSLQSGYHILYKFVSANSQEKDYPFFRNNLKECLDNIQKNSENLELLTTQLNQSVWRIIAWEDSSHHEINPRIEATSIMSDILGDLIQYAQSIRLVFPINISISDHLSKIIHEKLQKNKELIIDLFEKGLFIKDVIAIQEKQYEKISNFAKMHLPFNKSITQIQQESALITSLLKAIGEDQLSKCYEKFTFIIKKIPDQKDLTPSDIKNYLILPYKIFLDQTKDIKNRFTI
ncbi:hypothetical protein OAK75_11845 [Bacteriovoracales bacterium]|nr:hypothetical protein [Bacteriovoracales bacterium]